MKIKHYIEENLEVKHPFLDDLKGIYGVIFSDQPENEKADLRNVTIFADRQIDRSPCGTGQVQESQHCMKEVLKTR